MIVCIRMMNKDLPMISVFQHVALIYPVTLCFWPANYGFVGNKFPHMSMIFCLSGCCANTGCKTPISKLLIFFIPNLSLVFTSYIYNSTAWCFTCLFVNSFISMLVLFTVSDNPPGTVTEYLLIPDSKISNFLQYYCSRSLWKWIEEKMRSQGEWWWITIYYIYLIEIYICVDVAYFYLCSKYGQNPSCLSADIHFLVLKRK